MAYQQGWARLPAPLRGLDPAAIYSVTDRQGREVHRASGLELMTTGIPRDATGGCADSRTLHLKMVDK
jgi:hypothetical protein